MKLIVDVNERNNESANGKEKHVINTEINKSSTYGLRVNKNK